MTRVPITCNPDTTLEEVVKILTISEINALLVVSNEGNLQGLITHFDLMRFYDKDLKAIRARDIMVTALITISPNATVSEAAKKMIEKRIYRLIVKSEEEIRAQGVISASDIVRTMNIATSV